MNHYKYSIITLLLMRTPYFLNDYFNEFSPVCHTFQNNRHLSKDGIFGIYINHAMLETKPPLNVAATREKPDMSYFSMVK